MINEICLPPLPVQKLTCTCHSHHMIDPFLNSVDRNQVCNKRNIHQCTEKSNSSIWRRLFRTPTSSSYRRSCYYNEIDIPINNLDFRLRTCYDHAQETFAPKARVVVQPITIHHMQNQLNSSVTTIYPFKLVNGNRREHFNEATKGQHIASDHFANGKHGYSRVTGGAIPVD